MEIQRILQLEFGTTLSLVSIQYEVFREALLFYFIPSLVQIFTQNQTQQQLLVEISIELQEWKMKKKPWDLKTH